MLQSGLGFGPSTPQPLGCCDSRLKPPKPCQVQPLTQAGLRVWDLSPSAPQPLGVSSLRPLVPSAPQPLGPSGPMTGRPEPSESFQVHPLTRGLKLGLSYVGGAMG
mmetsp:Transcript_25506/g.39996  ORF Transcript_25506/g.39996 Transcript_25506/m.39996 type:complete len:106 (+) Transcript_25506:31-348(+)